MDDEISFDKSKYNEAALQIIRLNNLWLRVQECYSKGDLENAKWRLEDIWLELIADIDIRPKDEQRIIFKKKYILNRYLNKYKHNNELYYQVLHKQHQFLKILQNESGKGGVYDDGTEDDFD